MKLWYVLCVVAVCLPRGAASSINEEGMQRTITAAVKNYTTGTICLRSKVDDTLGICVYIHNTTATWDEAQDICTSWGGHLPEDHRHHSAEANSRSKKEETNVVFLTTKIKFLNGTWLGGHILPWEEDSSGEGYNEENECEGDDGPPRAPPPTPPPSWGHRSERGQRPPPPPPPRRWPPEPNCQGDKQEKINCGNTHFRKGKTMSSRCDCFRTKHYMCVTNRDKHTKFCPTGFNPCEPLLHCYKIGDPEANWFRANQQCSKNYGVLPSIDYEGLGNITALMKCADLEDIWTADSDAVWTWNSTGKIIESTNWQPGQPSCHPMGCILMAESGEWSAVDCQLKQNFMCIKRNSSCENPSCELIPYTDSSREMVDEQPTGTSPEPRHIMPTRSSKSMNGTTMGIVVGLLALVLIITTILIVVCCRIHKYRRKANELNTALEEQATYYQTLGRNYSIYENDGPDFETYAELSPDSPSSFEDLKSEDVYTAENGNVYTTVGEGNSPPTDDDQRKFNFPTRKGSLPARPDVVPLSIHQADPSAEDYLEVFPVPYKDLRQFRKAQMDISKNDTKESFETDNSGFLDEEDDEEDYADRAVDDNDDANTSVDDPDTVESGGSGPDTIQNAGKEEECSSHKKDASVIPESKVIDEKSDRSDRDSIIKTTL